MCVVVCDGHLMYYEIIVWCGMLKIVVFFFFKQKTAYEMRISDWSSDVCSSDLFDTAFFADDATVLQALVLSAKAFVVFDRAKNLGAEQTIALGLEGTVVNGFRLAKLAI